jgi:hypothetical protein
VCDDFLKDVLETAASPVPALTDEAAQMTAEMTVLVSKRKKS